MGTKAADTVKNPAFHGEQGNKSVWEGIYNKASVLNGDVLQMSILAAGSRVTDLDLVFDACGASATAKVGYSPVNSADGPTAVDNYWLAAGQDISSAGRLRSAAQPITFDFDVYVIVTIGGANFTGSPKVTTLASGEYKGTK